MAIERVRTNGFLRDDVPLENNVWIVGDDREVLVIDASHEPDPIIAAVGRRQVTAIVCTHGHHDHVNVAPALARAFDAPVALHPDDLVLWESSHPDREPDIVLAEGDTFSAGGYAMDVIRTPGHTPGSVCLQLASEGTVFVGDTLFPGGAGATRGPLADFGTIIESIQTRLFTLPPDTVVHPGHGESTTIGAESPHLAEWVRRGW